MASMGRWVELFAIRFSDPGEERPARCRTKPIGLRCLGMREMDQGVTMMTRVSIRLKLAALGAMLCASLPAQAKLYELSVSGKLISQTHPGDTTRWNVGDTIHVKARFDDRWLLTFDESGYSFAGLYGLPMRGSQFYVMYGQGSAWSSFSEKFDGDEAILDYYSVDHEDGTSTYRLRYLSSPAFALHNGKVVAVGGNMVPSGDVPVLDNHAWVRATSECSNHAPGEPITCRSDYHTGPYSDVFELDGGSFLYSNTYTGPDFVGRWDLENSSFREVTSVPEPATWAMMIGGLAVVGAASRRRSGKRFSAKCRQA